MLGVLQSGGGAGADFERTAYQGQSVLGDDTVQLSDLLNRGKPVVLNFWEGTCPPCRQEMPGFQRVYDDVQDDIILVGVDAGRFFNLGTRDDARRFLRDFEITYPAAYNKSNSPLRHYRVDVMPTTVFLSPTGETVSHHRGFLNESQLRAQVQNLIDVSERTAAS